MRILVCLGVVSACLSMSVTAAEPERYLLLLEHSPVLVRHLSPSQVVYTEDGISVVKVPFEDIEAWSERVHETLGGCGGFIDVTAAIDRGIAPHWLVWEEWLRRQKAIPVREYVVRGEATIANLVAEAKGEKLWTFLEELTSFPDRSATTDNGGKAADFLKDRADRLAGALPGFRTWKIATGTGSYAKQPSIVATLPGTDTTLPGVVLGAHMDTFSNAKPGADDDGSGSASVMEALRAVAATGARFKHTIHFIWYSAEERGLVGSGYVVDHFQSQNIAVKAAFQMDMVGWNSPADSADLFVITDYTDPSLTAALKKMIETYTTARVGETRCGYACSDHVNWHRAGIPAVFPFESSFGNMNQKLHTGDDKMSYLDTEHALKFVQTALAFLGEIAVLEGTATE